MAALNRRPAFLILLLSSNMALCSPLNCVPPSRSVPWDKGGSGAAAALDWRAVPACIGSGSVRRVIEILNRYYSDS